jgi:hypothetical protein
MIYNVIRFGLFVPLSIYKNGIQKVGLRGRRDVVKVCEDGEKRCVGNDDGCGSKEK